jgi:hypothetical protein
MTDCGPFLIAITAGSEKPAWNTVARFTIQPQVAGAPL